MEGLVTSLTSQAATAMPRCRVLGHLGHLLISGILFIELTRSTVITSHTQLQSRRQEKGEKEKITGK